MFVRFRAKARGLQVSVVEARRSEGRVHHEHIAGLGSVPNAPTPTDRIAFWGKLHQRLEALGNRLDAGQRGAILTAIHAHIPMPTAAEQQEVQLEWAREEARFWQSMTDGAAEGAETHRGVLATTQRVIAGREAAAAEFGPRAQAAKERLARVERGEVVAGVSRPLTQREMRQNEADAAHCVRLSEVAELVGLPAVSAELGRRKELVERLTIRQLHRWIVEGKV